MKRLKEFLQFFGSDAPGNPVNKERYRHVQHERVESHADPNNTTNSASKGNKIRLGVSDVMVEQCAGKAPHRYIGLMSGVGQHEGSHGVLVGPCRQCPGRQVRVAQYRSLQAPWRLLRLARHLTKPATGRPERT